LFFWWYEFRYFDIDERALAEAEKRREQKLAGDDQPIEEDNDCGDACKI